MVRHSKPPEQRSCREWYALNVWRRTRALHLKAEPLCRMCSSRGIVAVADVVDHIRPHGGSWTKFRTGELQSLCANCHEQTKKRFEADGYACDIGADGWPTDPKHPANSLKLRDPTPGNRGQV